MGEYRGSFTTWAGCSTSSRCRTRRLENYSVRRQFAVRHRNIIEVMHSALSEILDNTLPYDDVLTLRDRMWELCPSLVRYGTLERTSNDITLAGLKTLAARTASAKVTGAPFLKPISNFYQTDPISRACVLATFLLASESRHAHHGFCDVQVSDDGTMYTGVCQRRAIPVLRVGEVISGCVCMTRRAWCRRSIQFVDRWDLQQNKIKTILYRVLWDASESRAHLCHVG
jgi:hypothetical protein